MANIAQLVNVLQAVILTEGEKMLLTPTYHVFKMYRCHQDAELLHSSLETELIGAEEEKGNALVKETFPLLKECTDINFVGSIEAREIPHGEADVIVCEAFVGNVILKLYEGLAGTLVGAIKKGMMSTLRSKIGAALALPALKSTLKAFDATQYGGAPLLGLNGLVVKTHGSAKAVEITNSIFQCVTFKEQDINGKIRKNIISSTEQEGM